MAAGNTGTTTILRSVYAFIAAWIIGSVVGSVAERTITRNISDYKKDNPIPKTHADLLAGQGDEVSVEAVEAVEVGEEVTEVEELAARPAA